MPIVRVPYGNALPTVQDDYVRQNNLIAAGFMNINKPVWEDAANNIVQGAIFQVGGTVYHCTAATAIGGVASDYIKLTPSGDGSSLAPTYVANLVGVTWNSAYNGYYDVGGNAYVFDELVAIDDGELATANTRLWKALTTLLAGNFTFSGDPIFAGNIILDGGITEHSVTRKMKILDIGDWNMDTTPSVSVAHGLTEANIRSVSITIRDDGTAGVQTYPLNGDFINNTGGLVGGGGFFQVNVANIVCNRLTGGAYDANVNFDAVGYNRGWITIIYEV